MFRHSLNGLCRTSKGSMLRVPIGMCPETRFAPKRMPYLDGILLLILQRVEPEKGICKRDPFRCCTAAETISRRPVRCPASQSPAVQVFPCTSSNAATTGSPSALRTSATERASTGWSKPRIAGDAGGNRVLSLALCHRPIPELFREECSRFSRTDRPGGAVLGGKRGHLFLAGPFSLPLLGDICTYMRVLRASRAFWGRSRTINPAEGYR
jgi:hypothetical protein